MKKRKGILLLSLLIICLLFFFWLASYVKCEILTKKYSYLFSESYREYTMLSDVETVKVLSFNELYAKVYYITADRGSGNIISFTNQQGQWIAEKWQTVWSKTGSADGFVWPYFR